MFERLRNVVQGIASSVMGNFENLSSIREVMASPALLLYVKLYRKY